MSDQSAERFVQSAERRAQSGVTSSGAARHLPQGGRQPLRRCAPPPERAHQGAPLQGEACGRSLSAPTSRGNDSETVIVTPEALSAIVKELIAPVMETIGRMLENNTEAIERLSSAQQIQNDRLEALEKQIRLQTPVTSKQAAYINDAIRQRARELLDRKDVSGDKAIRKLSNQIRKAVLMRYGVAGVREIPKHEYNVALNQVGMWNDMLVVRDIVRQSGRGLPSPAEATP